MKSSLPAGRYWPWIVPLIALAVAGLLLAREYGRRGPTITLFAKENPGLEADVSRLRYRGVDCGQVVGVRLESDPPRVGIEVLLEDWASHLAREGSRFWIVAPRLEVGRVRGLEALRSGAFIAVAPGPADAAEMLEFDMLHEAPVVSFGTAGQRYHVYARHSHGVKVGAPVYYRGVGIGTVAAVELHGQGAPVRFALYVQQRYVPLIRAKTVFWPVTGIYADIGWLGAEIQTGTLESFWSGGIELATPPESPPIEDSTTFWLEEAREEDWLKWEPEIAL